MSATHNLFPNSKTPRLEQYRVAWDLLYSQTAREDERAHAKCWLTYRCADGCIKYADYIARVKSVGVDLSALVDEQKARWRVSIAMADIYAEIANSYSDEWVHKAKDLWDLCAESEIEMHQSSLLSFLKVSVLLAYFEHLKGDVEKTRKIIIATWKSYKKAILGWDWADTSFRAMEAVDDMRMLQMLQFISMENGLTRKAVSEWCTPRTLVTPNGVKSVPLLYCIVRMGQLATDKSRIIFPDPNKTEREAIADYAGGGLFVELGVASAAFAERVLDRNRGMTYLGIDKWDDHHNVAEMEKAAIKLSRFGSRAELKRASFGDAIEGVKDESCDVIYVDGYAHTGQDDGKTLRDWWPKVKSGGVFSGHDYDEKWPKTIAAVDEFAKSIGLPVEVIKDEPFSSWIIRKPAKPHP
jgi:hypothetical protein